MNPSDAAHILRLIQDAEKHGCVRHVFFFGKEKTKADIATYLKKTQLVDTEAQLLRQSDETEPKPDYITFKDSSPQSPQSDRTDDTSRVAALRDPHITMSYPIPIPDAGRDTRNLPSQEDPLSYVFISQDRDFKSSPQTHEVSIPLHDSPQLGVVGQPKHAPQGPAMSAYEPQSSFDGIETPFAGIYEPLRPYSNEAFLPVNMTTFNGLMSSTPYVFHAEQPPSETTSGMSFQALVQTMLGRDQDADDQSTYSFAKAFLRQCCEVCLYLGQDPNRVDAENLLAHTGHVFDLLLQSPDEWTQSLTVLNNLLTLFYTYGQVALSARICEYAYRAADRRFGSTHSITFMIQFMMSIQERPPGAGTPYYDIESLKHAHDLLVTMAGEESQLALTARYNLAWALTEVEQYEEALEILMHLQAPCERTFGASQIQTIACISTLARVYLYTKREISAECLMRETIATRIEDNFLDSHPYFWEARNRHSLFLLKIANAQTLPHKKQQYLDKAEKTLQEVLLWRFVNLGPNNPRTSCTFRALRRLLRRQQRMDEADSLYQWCTDATRPYFQPGISQHRG